MKELKVQPIRNGTVIDHITPGNALKVLTILGLPRPGSSSIISVAMNVTTSRPQSLKDIVKIEDRELDDVEIDKIALVAPHATVSFIRNYNVAEKRTVELGDEVGAVARCPNPSCISHQGSGEPVASRFAVLSRDPPRLRCHYCGRELEDVATAIVQ